MNIKNLILIRDLFLHLFLCWHEFVIGGREVQSEDTLNSSQSMFLGKKRQYLSESRALSWNPLLKFRSSLNLPTLPTSPSEGPALLCTLPFSSSCESTPLIHIISREWKCRPTSPHLQPYKLELASAIWRLTSRVLHACMSSSCCSLSWWGPPIAEVYMFWNGAWVFAPLYLFINLLPLKRSGLKIIPKQSKLVFGEPVIQEDIGVAQLHCGISE